MLLCCPDMRQQHLRTGKYNIVSCIQLSLTGTVLNGMQASLQRVEGVSHRQWEDALTVGELKGKYAREQWLKSAEAEAISLHHEQRSRGTVPSYGQALAMATLMEEMHLEVQSPRERNTPDPPSRQFLAEKTAEAEVISLHHEQREGWCLHMGRHPQWPPS